MVCDIIMMFNVAVVMSACASPVYMLLLNVCKIFIFCYFVVYLHRVLNLTKFVKNALVS